MASNRKACEEFIYGFMGRLTRGGGNRTIYERLFKQMNNAQFEEFVVKLENGMPLSIWASNYDKKEMIDYENVLKLCKEIGVELETEIVIYDPDTGVKTKTAIKHMVGVAEVRKQRQMWVKKFSAAKDDTQIDDLTGQVMGDSRSTGLSMPEIQVLRNLGLHTMANELYNVKGGDVDALKAYRGDLMATGSTTTNGSLRQGTIAKSLKTTHFLLRGRHLDNNIDKRYG